MAAHQSQSTKPLVAPPHLIFLAWFFSQAMIDGDILANFPTVPGSGVEGYGKFIGTCMVGALLEIILSFVPPGACRAIRCRAIRRNSARLF